MKKESGVNERYLKEIYLNVLKAIIIVVYFFALNLSYENVTREHLLIGIKAFTMIFLFVAIYIFEKAYKKDDGKLAIQGIEILLLAAYTLTTEHITNKYNFNFKSYSLVASYISAIYFILKSIIVYTKGRKAVVEELSDIREIVQKKEPTKKEATKKVKEEKVEEQIEDNKEIENKENKPTQKKKKKVSDDSLQKNTTNKKKPSQGKTNSVRNSSAKTNSTKTNSTKTNTTKKPSTKVAEGKTQGRSTTEKTTTETAKKKRPSNTVKRDNVDNTNRVKKTSNESLEERPKRKKVKKEVTEND